jgi:hypothetical protein
MPFYEITTKGEEAKRLIKAPSAKAAIQHCLDPSRFSARTVATVQDAADLFEAGVKIEHAGAAD